LLAQSKKERIAGTAERKLHFGTGGKGVSRRYAADYSPVIKVPFGGHDAQP